MREYELPVSQKQIKTFTMQKDTWAYNYLNPETLETKNDDCPTWDSFVSRTSAPEQFKAWIWSCYDENYRGREVLWLHGAGNDGKTIAQSAITRYHEEQGQDIVASFPTGDQADVQKNAGTLIGKRICMHPDCKFSAIVTTAFVHSIVGNDMMSVRKLYQDPVNVRIFVRLWINSNYHPAIDVDKVSDMSRLLYIHVSHPKEFIDDMETKMVNEYPAFLKKCKESYEKISKNSFQIQNTEEMIEQLQTFADPSTIARKNFILKHIKQSDYNYISAEDLQAFISTVYKNNNYLYDNVYGALKRKYKVSMKILKGELEPRIMIHGLKAVIGDTFDPDIFPTYDDGHFEHTGIDIQFTNESNTLEEDKKEVQRAASILTIGYLKRPAWKNIDIDYFTTAEKNEMAKKKVENVQREVSKSILSKEEIESIYFKDEDFK
jgi:hypothetical protein